MEEKKQPMPDDRIAMAECFRDPYLDQDELFFMVGPYVTKWAGRQLWEDLGELVSRFVDPVCKPVASAGLSCDGDSYVTEMVCSVCGASILPHFDYCCKCGCRIMRDDNESEGRQEMQHIINVAFDFDDEAITNYIENQAVDDVRNRITEKIESELKRYDGYENAEYWEVIARDAIAGFFGEHRDEIVDKAALMLAMRGRSTKKWKETLADANAELGES